jgi:DNA-binding MarR family transcriptional regulator
MLSSRNGPTERQNVSDYAPQDTPARLAFAFGRMNRRLVSATGGLSHGLLSALATVAKRGPIRLRELGRVEMISAPSITRVVAELETRKLVARRPDPTDGRAHLLEVTSLGLDAIFNARAARAEVTAELLGKLSADEVKSLEAALPALESMLDGIS